MHQEPVSPDPGPSCPDWMDDPAYLAMRAEDEAAGRRGPGMPGSAESFPGVYVSRASGFASGKPLDVAPGGVRWTTPSGRQYVTEPTRYPI
ncbi:MAG: hypothetical protein ACRDOA_18195 [Streptosporangiaceae bacterium]